MYLTRPWINCMPALVLKWRSRAYYRSASLDMKANTGAEINGKVDIGRLTVDQSTGSKVNLTGKAENWKLKAAPAADSRERI